MAINDYVVLRAPSLWRSEFGTPRAGTRGGPLSADPSAGVEFRVETGALSKGDIGNLRKDPEVISYAPVMPVKLHEPLHSRDVQAAGELTWGVESVGANSSPFSGNGVKVAVLDTGIDAAHVAFQGMELLQQDFSGEGDGDANGHGTHVAGTIFGQAVAGLRIGVAPAIDQALIGKVLGAQGGGSTQSIVKAIEWAIQSGANIISMSLGMDFPGLVQRLIQSDLPVELATSMALESYRANVNLFNTLGTLAERSGEFFQATILLAAAGNESRRNVDARHEIAAAPPAAAEGISSVGALGESAQGLVVAPFSNTKPDLSAPGVDIVSAATGGGLRQLSGTSMATPHVSGVAALWAEKLTTLIGSYSSKTLTAKLIASATLTPLAPEFDHLDVGMGLVQAPQD